jgi:LytS/YehU family sensor histidine kinase
VRHGIDPSEEGGSIEVSGFRAAPGQPLRLRVSDSGVGLTQQMGSGTGLRNLRERLQVFYGETARLDLTENQPHGLRAEIEFTP